MCVRLKLGNESLRPHYLVEAKVKTKREGSGGGGCVY